jgi:hypothetical protein
MERKFNEAENAKLMRNGELYFAFTPDLMKQRRRARDACTKFNEAGEVSRRRLVELWRK